MTLQISLWPQGNAPPPDLSWLLDDGPSLSQGSLGLYLSQPPRQHAALCDAASFPSATAAIPYAAISRFMQLVLHSQQPPVHQHKLLAHAAIIPYMGDSDLPSGFLKLQPVPAYSANGIPTKNNLK